MVWNRSVWSLTPTTLATKTYNNAVSVDPVTGLARAGDHVGRPLAAAQAHLGVEHGGRGVGQLGGRHVAGAVSAAHRTHRTTHRSGAGGPWRGDRRRPWRSCGRR